MGAKIKRLRGRAKKFEARLNGIPTLIGSQELNRKTYWSYGFLNKYPQLRKMRDENFYLKKHDWSRFFFDDLIMTLYIKILPHSRAFKTREIFNLKIMDHVNVYRIYRLYMGFPIRGQRTWSNARTAKRHTTLIKEWFVERHCRQYRFKCSRTRMLQVTHMEFFNTLWYRQWHHEWRSARSHFAKHTTGYKRRMWRFGIDFIMRNKPLTYYKDPYKAKRTKGKRKAMLPKNQHNVGFNFNFTIRYFRKLFSVNVWRKKKKLLL